MLTAKSTDILEFWKQALDESQTMNKHPLVIFRWNRSKDFILWNTDLDLDHQVEYKVFGYKFKMGLLSDWIDKFKLTKVA